MNAPGDVANEFGDILLMDNISLLSIGIVVVTEEQAKIAKAFGWNKIPNYPEVPDGLCAITRGIKI